MFLTNFSASTGPVSQQHLLTLPGTLKTNSHANGNVARDVVELSGNKPVEVSVGYRAQTRVGKSTILTSRTRMGRGSRDQDFGFMRAHVERRSITRRSSSAVLVAEDDNVLMKIVSDDTRRPAAETNTVLFEGSLHKYCGIFRVLSRKCRITLSKAFLAQN